MTASASDDDSSDQRSPPAQQQQQRGEIKAVLCDLDGTLLDTEALSDKAMYQAFLKNLLLSSGGENNGSDTSQTTLPPLSDLFPSDGPPPPPDGLLPWELKKQILGLRGSEWGPIVLKYAQEHRWNVPPPPSDKHGEKNGQSVLTAAGLWSSWEHELNALCQQVEACPGAPELVATLSNAGFPLAIATSSRHEAVLKKGTRHGKIFDKMDAIVAGDDPAVKCGKPAPDIYLEASRRLSVKPSDCLVLEDALTGVRAGKAAGCFVVAVPDPRFSESEKAVFAAEADIVLDSLHDFGTVAEKVLCIKNFTSLCGQST